MKKPWPKEDSPQWGPWHDDGNRYRVRLWHDGHDTYPNNFRANVEILDTADNKVYRRVGLGKCIGNFCPIWVSWSGKKVQLTQLLREKQDDRSTAQ